MILSLLILSVVLVVAKQNCEVCVRVLDKIIAEIPAKDKKNLEKIDNVLNKFCEKHQTGEERRVCYSIETIQREVTKPIFDGVPSELICKRLSKRDNDICKIPEGGSISAKKIDLTKVDVDKLSLSDLKKVLNDNNLKCQGCTDKSEFIKLVKEKLLPKKSEL